MSKKDALATKEQETALANTFADFAADGAAYQDEFTKSDFAIPFLQVIQSNSKQVSAGDPKYLEDAKAGMLIETASNTLYDVKKKPLVLIPAHYVRKFVVWRLREQGGGFVREHDVIEGEKIKATCTSDEKGRLITPDGYQLVDTAQYAVVIVTPDGPVSALFPLTSTQLKKSRQWNTAIDTLRVEINGKRVRPPMFYQSYEVTTVPEKNDKGNWMGLKITPYQNVQVLEDGETYYNAAKVLREGILSGTVSTAKSAAAAEGDGFENPDAEPADHPFGD